tara:strand:- start:127 stop:336 length:210 start_codon:yes stop_codon:yes gene_type:complete
MVTSTSNPILLKLRRIEKGIRAYDFASELGISPSKLSLIENGLEQADFWLKERSAEILKLPFEELWGDN